MMIEKGFSVGWTLHRATGDSLKNHFERDFKQLRQDAPKRCVTEGMNMYGSHCVDVFLNVVLLVSVM